MNDDTNLDFKIMNDDLRVRLVEVHMNEAIECEWTDDETRAVLRAILLVPNGEPIIGADDEDDDLTPVQTVAQLIDYHWGNFA